jgi:hydroxyacylglutathione hydrolase
MLQVTVIPALVDNYIWLLRDTASGMVAVVDPAEVEPVNAILEQQGWRLNLILNTHHHADHTGGNDELKRKWRATVIGPEADHDRIPEIDIAYRQGEQFSVGSQTVTVIDTPGHTRGHIAFWFAGAGTLFCGDTLFSLGCGRLFEGTPEQMWDSLLKLRALPDETRIYCGHEYTQPNGRFALSIDPDNAVLQARMAEVDALRAAGKPTLPALLGVEKQANPFLRADDPALAARLGLADAPPPAVLAGIRRRKDQFHH